MKTTDPVELLKQMLEIYSPSGKENKLAIFLKEQLTQMGFQNVRLDKVGNVYGEVGTGSKTILLCGHMDTVPGYLPVKVENGKVYGRGAVDAKSSLASMIVASSELVAQDNGKIMVACVVDEERKARGVRQMLRDKLSVDYAIFGEPAGVNNITIGYKGRLGVKMLCETEPGHAGAQQAFKNAIEEAYELWNKIKERLSGSQSSILSPYQSVTACLTGMWGGEAFNVVPSTCKLNIDVRLPLRLNCEKGISLVRAVIQQYQLENPRVELKMTIEDEIEPFLADKDSAIVRALTWAIKDTVGGSVRLLKKTGTGDMNIFATKVNVPVVTYGPGNSHLSHTLNEYVEISEYLASIKVHRKTVERLLSL